MNIVSTDCLVDRMSLMFRKSNRICCREQNNLRMSIDLVSLCVTSRRQIQNPSLWEFDLTQLSRTESEIEIEGLCYAN
jgi:hypothetical protein